MSWGCDDLTVRYGDREGLRGVSVDVATGTVTTVIGGDGAGKTSLLAAIAGSRPAVHGRIRRPPAERIGVLPATSGAWGDLTVDENLSFAAGAYGVPARRRDERITELLERCRLTAARDRRADQLSGGMRQKLGLAMALVHRPELVILDEPTTGIDPVSRAELWQLVAGAAANGAAVLLSTTYLDEAERAGQLVLLDAGQVLAAGDVDDVVAHVRGTVAVSDTRPDSALTWRRGPVWRSWWPDGPPPDDATAVPPDLEDAVMIVLYEESMA